VRHAILILHRYVGLALAGFLILLGLTGSVIAFKRDLDKLVNAQLFAELPTGEQSLRLAELAERAEALVAPEGRVIYFTVEPDQAAFVIFPAATDSASPLTYNRLFLDPATGRELGRRREGDISQGMINLIPFIYYLHRELAAGPWGAWFLGVLALAWTLDCVLAVYLTLPRGWRNFWRRWTPSWRIKRCAHWFRLNFDLHRAGSLWLWPVLFMFAWSSVMLDLHSVYKPVTAALFDTTDFAAILAATHPNPHPKIDWRQAEDIGATLMADLAARDHFEIGAPDGFGYLPEQGVYLYDVHSSRDVWWHGWNTGIWLDGDTGDLRMFMPTTGAHLGDTVSAWLRGLHFGDVHDFLLYRIFDCLMGLVLAILSGTGVYVWLRKHAARRHARRRTLGYR
jgi:uncharacterized iron-regulated membrane protein